MEIQLIATYRLIIDDVKDELRSTIEDDMEVETEPNVYEQNEEYVKEVEVKQTDDISVKPLCFSKRWRW
jgi:hypothetical protein